jgi:hypothetical protein
MSHEQRDATAIKEVSTVPVRTPETRAWGDRRRCSSRDTAVIAMTDARTYRGHLVTNAAATAGRANVGRYVAVPSVVLLAEFRMA